MLRAWDSLEGKLAIQAEGQPAIAWVVALVIFQVGRVVGGG